MYLIYGVVSFNPFIRILFILSINTTTNIVYTDIKQ